MCMRKNKKPNMGDIIYVVHKGFAHDYIVKDKIWGFSEDKNSFITERSVFLQDYIEYFIDDYKTLWFKSLREVKKAYKVKEMKDDLYNYMWEIK